MKYQLLLWQISLMFILYDADVALSMNIGDPFPPFSITNFFDTDECKYLGIDCKKDFALVDLNQEVIVLERLNVYCDTCRDEVDKYNDLYLITKNNPDYINKVIVIGIAVGNSMEEVIDFKDRFGAMYPIVSDQQKKTFNLTGGLLKIPHTDILKKDGDRFVLNYHSNGDYVMERTIDLIESSLQKETKGKKSSSLPPAHTFVSETLTVHRDDALTELNVTNQIEGDEYRLEHGLDDEDIIQLIEDHLKKSGKKVISTEKIIMKNRKEIYITSLSPLQEKNYLFARMESQPSLCDVCHDTHFIYIIDQRGIIYDLIPVQLAKAENINWTTEDVLKIKGRILGKSIFNEFSFNPKIDAVTTATLTSSLMFESINSGKTIFNELKYYNFRWDYWKQVCMQNYCNIKRKIEEIEKGNKDFILNDATLQVITSKYHLPGCPLHGIYVVVDGEIICSVFGSHLQKCEY